jgi:hypothetical protein
MTTTTKDWQERLEKFPLEITCSLEAEEIQDVLKQVSPQLKSFILSVEKEAYEQGFKEGQRSVKETLLKHSARIPKEVLAKILSTLI